MEDTSAQSINMQRPSSSLSGEILTVNFGPQHPSTHGVLRLRVDLDGEVVTRVEPVIGYLHTGIEKNIEALKYNQAVTLTDRTDYLAPPSNNLAYCMAVEKLLGLEVPERAQALRVIMAELARIGSHLVYLGTSALELGAMSVFLYCFRERELILDMNEEISGVRMMTSYIRVGGVMDDITPRFEKMVRDFIKEFPSRVDEYEALLTENPIWQQRTKGIGVLPKDLALEIGATGASLRASGHDYDVRKYFPYCGYEKYDFDVPVGENGDCFDRYYCRVKEMRESIKIIQQALDGLPEGPYINRDARKIVPPPREELETSMEAVIHHFKIFTEGFSPPPGDAYAAVESPRGEYGVYLVSDGTNKPRRAKIRAPSFVNLQALQHVCVGHLVADLIAIIGTFDTVMGDCDR